MGKFELAAPVGTVTALDPGGLTTDDPGGTMTELVAGTATATACDSMSCSWPMVSSVVRFQQMFEK